MNKRIEKTCPTCGRGFTTYRPEQVCCSHGCRSARRTALLDKCCERCGRPLQRRRNEQFSAYKRRRFCSRQCWREHRRLPSLMEKLRNTWFRRGKEHPFWRGGRSYAFDRNLSWERQRVLALERDGFRCQLCARSSRDALLNVHHIVPFEETRDNGLDNLVTLCAACHRQVHAEQRSAVS